MQNAITSPPVSASIRAQSAATRSKRQLDTLSNRGEIAIAKSVIQNAAPPAAANVSSFLEDRLKACALLGPMTRVLHDWLPYSNPTGLAAAADDLISLVLSFTDMPIAMPRAVMRITLNIVPMMKYRKTLLVA